jgi:hypothetical protein
MYKGHPSAQRNVRLLPQVNNSDVEGFRAFCKIRRDRRIHSGITTFEQMFIKGMSNFGAVGIGDRPVKRSTSQVEITKREKNI